MFQDDTASPKNEEVPNAIYEELQRAGGGPLRPSDLAQRLKLDVAAIQEGLDVLATEGHVWGSTAAPDRYFIPPERLRSEPSGGDSGGAARSGTHHDAGGVESTYCVVRWHDATHGAIVARFSDWDSALSEARRLFDATGVRHEIEVRPSFLDWAPLVPAA
jgi:hypothetical protein